jgi:GSCFA family
MSGHPYGKLPRHANWRRALVGVPLAEVDPVVNFPFRLAATDRIATAGSCFAQHIARHLRRRGYNYFVTEPPHTMLSAELAQQFNYGTFSARYGNLYTTRQLLQLFQRAYGQFSPADHAWVEADGSWVDPYRPQIQPGGFLSQREFEVDRERHLAAVRRLFAELDVFVFTLGLTETWCACKDGAVYPVCPGVSGGRFDPEQHEFQNFGTAEVTADMLAFIDALRGINPGARVILTVSPVPLMATAEPEHVLVSTTYSKAVLRVACEQICAARPDVAYFPSYEIVTGAYTRGAYFADDLRSVTEAGVAHVMRLFTKHATAGAGNPPAAAPAALRDAHVVQAARLVELNCDEAALDNGHID